MPLKYKTGDQVQLVDRIDPEIIETGTVHYCEQDPEGFVFLYIVADNEMLNDKFEHGFRFWCLVEQNDPYLSLA